MKLVSADKMRELEKRADASGNTYADMMERAGTLTARAIVERRPVEGRRVLVLVGPGNNGGDGLVCARVLREAGARVYLYLWKRQPNDDDVNWRLCREHNIPFNQAEEDRDFAYLKGELEQADFVVDAFLGTGVARPIEGLLKQILGTVRAGLENRRARSEELVSPAQPYSEAPTPPYVVAVDLPTGLNPDTGALDSAAVPADLTVTFAFPKIGQYTFPGAGAVGELVIADIGIRREWAQDIPLDVATGPEIHALLPARPLESNKGTYGKALLACGSLDFTGAPRLAAMAAARVGAGLVTLAVPETIYPIVGGSLSEATYLPVDDHEGAWLPRSAGPVTEHAGDYEALLVGCGFGREDSTRQFVAQLFGVGSTAQPKSHLPSLVIDADALNALAELKDWWKGSQFSATPILTPHPGEMGRLTQLSISEIQRNRVGTASEHARLWNAVVVLKGAFTVVARPDGRSTLIPFATPALATAGTGDVLAGTLVGLLAQYRAHSLKAKRDDGDTAAVDACNAAVAGAYIHGLAGRMVAEEIGLAGAIAGDLIPLLPEAIREIKGEE